MEEPGEYGVSYIAEAPFKVGDLVIMSGWENAGPLEIFEIDGEYARLKKADNPYTNMGMFAMSKLSKYTPNPIRFDQPTEKATSRQVGGDHYKMPIQPVEFIERNNLGFCVGNCIKYLCRYKRKNGREDLEKARHYIDLLIQMEYPDVDFENEG